MKVCRMNIRFESRLKMKFVALCLLFVIKYCDGAVNRTSQKEALIILEEAEMGQTKPENRAGYEEDVCSPQSICIAITSCPLIDDLLDKSCFASDKLTALTCGWVNGEVRVCCPPGGMRPLGPSRQPDGGGLPPGVQADTGDASVSNYGSASESCGRPMVQANNYEGIGSHPWVVRIGFMNKASGRLRYPCSGSIISRRVILTAAHCALAKADGFSLSTVAIGEWNTETDPDCGDMFCANPVQVMPISHVVVHPGYDKKIYRHDIALIVLKEEMKYTLTSLPICISGTRAPSSGTRALLSGWGRMPGERAAPPVRQVFAVPLLPLGDCARVYSSAAPLSTAQMCAGAEDGRDACAGFGGGPLIVMMDGKYTQIGIVSFGSENCGSPGAPSVYTNVHSYANWIKENSPAP